MASTEQKVRDVGVAVQSGTAILDFGDSFNDSMNLFVAQSTIPASAHVRAWMSGRSMSDNDANDHILAGLWMRLVTSVATTNSGFTIFAMCLIGKARGKFRVDWSWS